MAIDPASVDWSSARRASYQLLQTFRYVYPQPIRDLSHRLIVIPPERFGDQRRLRHNVSVALEGARVENRTDRFGNMIVDVFAPRVPAPFSLRVRPPARPGWDARVGRGGDADSRRDGGRRRPRLRSHAREPWRARLRDGRGRRRLLGRRADLRHVPVRSPRQPDGHQAGHPDRGRVTLSDCSLSPSERGLWTRRAP